jgi:hypothetical protein
MRRAVLALAVASVLIVVCVHGRAYAQEPPAPLPRIVVDLHGIIPVFPNDNAQLANSRFVSDQARQLSVGELPGAGLGGRVGVHLYLLKWKAMTIGLGGEVLVGRSTSTPIDTASAFVAVSERLTSADGQVSFNFGSAHGWSYLSGGMGRSQWSIVPAGSLPTTADAESLPTVNYGGGAHWSIKRHVGFSLDVRLYEIQPGAPTSVGPGSPRTRLLVAGAGIFLK